MAPRTPLLAVLLLLGTACASVSGDTQQVPLWPGRAFRLVPVGGAAEFAWVSASEGEAEVRAVGADGTSRLLDAPLGGETVRIEDGEVLEMRAPVAGPAMVAVWRAVYDSDVEVRAEEVVGGESRQPVLEFRGQVLIDPGRTLAISVSESESLMELLGPAIGEFEIEVLAGGGASNRIDVAAGIVFRGPTDLRIRHGAPNPRPLLFRLADSDDWTITIED